MGTATRYVYRKKIADGGMAEIFLANQAGAEGFARPVILKRILPGLSADPQFRDMLIHEAHIAMSLSHGNIVPVLDLGQSQGRYFLAMELVEGWDLATVIKRARAAQSPMPLGLALYIVGEVCRGLAFAHARPGPYGNVVAIVHRDVSPQNVLVSEQGQVKLTDFGIAKAMGKPGSTRTGVIKGKLDFMSPEQASGQPLAPSSDVYAVGTILYMLATGKAPFEGESDLQVLLKVQRGDFVPVKKVAPDLPAGVVAILDKAMQRQPADRYQTAEGMLLEIEEVLRNEFRSPGQSELKRWLAELSRKDNFPTTSQLPGLPVNEPLGPLTVTVTSENPIVTPAADSAAVSGFERTRMQDTGDRALAAAPKSIPPPLPPAAAPATPPPAPLAPSKAPTPPPLLAPRTPATLGPVAVMRARVERRRSSVLGASVALLLAIVAAVSLGAHRLFSPSTRATVAETARSLLEKADLDRLAPGATKEPAPPAKVPPAASAPEPEPEREREPEPEPAPTRANDEADKTRRPAESRDRVTIKLVSRPPGARVMGRSGQLGRTPLPYTARVGKSEVLRFAKTGYASTSKRITADSRTRTVVVELRRKRR